MTSENRAGDERESIGEAVRDKALFRNLRVGLAKVFRNGF
jgi:hypothetical protein